MHKRAPNQAIVVFKKRSTARNAIRFDRMPAMISTADVAPIDIAWIKFAYGLKIAINCNRPSTTETLLQILNIVIGVVRRVLCQSARELNFGKFSVKNLHYQCPLSVSYRKIIITVSMSSASPSSIGASVDQEHRNLRSANERCATSEMSAP